ncbi:hypothetical protein PAECIP111893_05037 [Paenibacillus plantiphilus]|uniref:Glycosyltransferase 2-like domain-containing protein n=1 Tax=Paenibacillus plantiphilus TaxID=2905650 RepID=A0ABN8H0J4_9BACL|nr:glycosyltransferase [Paenibacillus plantiphilus]CAH1223743.1 hypothetical protein PAECIP111893_05037 [Paenibacillus plantiphilus]
MKMVSYILVNNNEATLADAIRSVKGHADEVIVVDTGSTDNSVRIALDLGARVYYFAWNGNFSEARNYALHLVQEADWVLVIDSDEVFEWRASISLKEWAMELDPERTVAAFNCSHLESSNSRLLSVTHVERLFSPAFFYYAGTVHERLLPHNKMEKKEIRLCPCAGYRHYGYSSEYHEVKSSRNIGLLQQAVGSDPSDGFNYRYLASETYNAGYYADTIKYADTALHLLAAVDTYSRAQAHYYKTMALLQLRNNAEAELAAVAGMKELGDYPDLYAIAAEICFDAQRWEEACTRFNEWQQRLQNPAKLYPNHCISLAETFHRHQWIAANKTGNFKNTLRGEAQNMKVALLIVHPHLDNDWEELLSHIQSKFQGLSYEVGLWSKEQFGVKAKSIAEKAGVRYIKGKSLAEAEAALLNACNADLLWVWKANERISSALNEELLLAAFAHNGTVAIRSYSERLGHQWTESRIRMKPMPNKVVYSASQAEAAADVEFQQEPLADRFIVVEKPLFIPVDKQREWVALLSEETSVQRLLAYFGCHRYSDVLAMDVSSKDAAAQLPYQFYQVLSYMNLGMIEQASELIYTVLDAELEEQEQLDFIYLLGKLAVNAQIEEMKRETIELLQGTVQSNPLLETRLVLTEEPDWLALIAELQWQLGERKQAILSWRHALESAAYCNEGCAYRLAEAVYEEYKTEGFEAIARAILEIFNVDSPTAQSLLYPVYTYLNMPEWALLFQRFLAADTNNTQNNDAAPLVSVILPIHNDTRYLVESIRSILSQTCLELELIIVDDGSDGEVRAIADRFKFDSRLSFYRLESNGGLPRALNYGISKAKGAYMAWTSADNYAHPRWLERMVQTISANPRASAVMSDYYHVDENGLVLETKRMPAYKLNGLQNGGPSLLWRTSSLKKTGGFDESLFGIEDRDFTIRLALAGNVHLLPEPLYYYRIHEDSLSSRIDAGSLGGWPELHEKLKRKWLCLSFV